MPCYCDIPDEKDQAEIEERCKTMMYFDAQTLLTKEQIKKCNEMELSLVPYPDPNTALCKLCKVLTDDQMKNIAAYYYQIKWSHKTLYDWYKQHCDDDELNR